jgi:hypothetical protein
VSVLFEGRWALDTPISIFSAAQRTTIDKLTACNTGPDDVVLTLYLVPPGMTAQDQYQVVSGAMIQAGGTYLCAELVGHDLEAGGEIFAEASIASVVSVRASGRLREVS